MSKYLTVVPAYGRDYTSAKAVRSAWAEGKDFLISDRHNPHDGQYVNNAQTGGLTVNVRYNGKRDVCVITPGKGK